MSGPLDPAAILQLVDASAVYRMFDADGRLLYVGKTSRTSERFGEHSIKRWFPLVASITLKWYGGEAEAGVAERAAIRVERPMFNLSGLGTYKGDAARAKPWQQAPIFDPPAAQAAISDVLSVFDGERHLHWQTIAERLVITYPERWGGVDVKRVAAKMRGLGIPSVDVREPRGSSRKGCRRADVEAASGELAA